MLSIATTVARDGLRRNTRGVQQCLRNLFPKRLKPNQIETTWFPTVRAFLPYVQECSAREFGGPPAPLIISEIKFSVCSKHLLTYIQTALFQGSTFTSGCCTINDRKGMASHCVMKVGFSLFCFYCGDGLWGRGLIFSGAYHVYNICVVFLSF